MQEFIGSVVETPKRVRRTFSKQFKAILVRLEDAGERSIASIAQEHEINANLLHKWVVLAKEGNAAPAMVPVAVPQVAITNAASVEICAQGCTIKLFSDWEPEKVAAWGHVRRKFYEIDQVHPNTFAGTVLKHIAELYQIEKEIRCTSVEQRATVRQARAGPILDALKEKLNTVLRTVPRKSPQAKAIHYALKRWDALTVYISDGLIDNNPVERQIRPVALERKNYLFAVSDSGGESAATMYCKA